MEVVEHGSSPSGNPGAFLRGKWHLVELRKGFFVRVFLCNKGVVGADEDSVGAKAGD